VFNPELQAAKFDPRSEYIRAWAPEHSGAEATDAIVDLGETRKRALAAYAQMRSTSA